MGLFDFFKKKEVVEKEEIKFEKIPELVSLKKNSFKEIEKEILLLIKGRVEPLLEEFEKELLSLEDIDFNKKKIEEKLRIISIEGFNKFKELFEELIQEIKVIEYLDLKKVVKAINELFDNFNKKSFKSFERATLLIGKELGEIKKSKYNFLRDFNKIFENNHKEIENYEIVSDIEMLLIQIGKLNLEIKNFKDKLNHLDIDKDKLNEKIKELDSKRLKVKNSEDYLKKQKRLKKFEEDKKLLNDYFRKLKNKIDFKSLASIHHSNQKTMQIIKNYKDDFNEMFRRDKGNFIIENNKSDEVKELIDKIIELDNKINDFSEDKDEILLIDELIFRLENDNREIDRIKDKFQTKISEIKREIDKTKEIIKDKLEKINFILCE